MKKSTINFIIDVLMFICMAAVAGIGFLIKYTLISGRESWIVYGDKVDLYFLGIYRHEWGTIHLIIGFVLLALVALHVILHWKLIVSLYNRMFQGKLVRRIITVVFIAICALFIIVSPCLIKYRFILPGLQQNFKSLTLILLSLNDEILSLLIVIPPIRCNHILNYRLCLIYNVIYFVL